jgi:hypothetical protein
MPISRTDIIRGPAIVTFDGVTMYTEGDITTEESIETFPIATSMFGPQTDERVDAIVQTVSFTPVGVYAYRTKLFPHLTPVIGASIFADKDLVIKTLAGVTKTLHNAAVSQQPTLFFSATKQLYGPVTFTAIGADNVAWSGAAKRQTVASAAFSDVSFNPDHILTQPYAAAWGASSPWDVIESEDGFSIESSLSLQAVTTDTDGVVDMTLGDVNYTAKCIPVGITEAELLALLKLQGSGVARGKSLAANANDLVLTGTGVVATLTKCAPKTGPTRYGATTLRAGELGFSGVRKFVTGALQPMLVLGTGS